MVVLKMHKFTITLLLVMAYGSANCQIANADGEALAKIDENIKVVRVGLRNDVKPFSYPHESLSNIDILPTYKGYMVNVCRRVLRRMRTSSDYKNLIIQPVLVNAKDRFNDLETGKVDMLCGPDSVTTDRLEKFNVSHPMFLSGMTYGYLEPTSRKFPRAEYCGNIVGFVNNTTAESRGIRQLSQDGVLMRFDDAVDLNLDMDARRFDILNEKVEAKREELTEYHTRVSEIFKNSEIKSYIDELRTINPAVEEHLRCTYKSEFQEHFVTEKSDGYRFDEGVNKSVQDEIAKQITTSECPNGFTEGLPIRKYPSHDEGIKAFCEGNILYYLGDYDILHSKVKEHADCDVVFNRFTTNKEVYGAFFRSTDIAEKEAHPVEDCSYGDEIIESNFSTKEKSATLYADFNRTLLRMMQADIDVLGNVYKSEFAGEPMSADLEAFFSGFRVAADLGQLAY